MTGSMLLSFFMIASAKKSRRKRLTGVLIPATIPVAPAYQPAISAITADMQVRSDNTGHAIRPGFQTAPPRTDGETPPCGGVLRTSRVLRKILCVFAVGNLSLNRLLFWAD